MSTFTIEIMPEFLPTSLDLYPFTPPKSCPRLQSKMSSIERCLPCQPAWRKMRRQRSIYRTFWYVKLCIKATSGLRVKHKRCTFPIEFPFELWKEMIISGTKWSRGLIHSDPRSFNVKCQNSVPKNVQRWVPGNQFVSSCFSSPK